MEAGVKLEAWKQRLEAATFGDRRQHFGGNIWVATFRWQHFGGNVSVATFRWQHFGGNVSVATFR